MSAEAQDPRGTERRVLRGKGSAGGGEAGVAGDVRAVEGGVCSGLLGACESTSGEILRLVALAQDDSFC